MKKTLYIPFLLLTSIHACEAAGIYGKEVSNIICSDIKLLSNEQVKMLSTGIMIGATAEGLAVSIFSRVGLKNEDDQAYIKGVSYSAFSSLSPELIARKTREACKDGASSDKQVVDILIEHIQGSLIPDK